MLANAINTPRTMLRQYQVEDNASILKLLQANEERIAANFPITYQSLEPEGTLKSWIEENTHQDWKDGKMYNYGIWHKKTKEYIGQVSVKNVDTLVRKAELAYYLDQRYEGRGLMSEVMSCVVDACFDDLELNRLYVHVLTKNQRSVNLVERCGFSFEGVLRQDFQTYTGQLEDVKVYGLLSEEY